jgi:hypothetical protein
MKLTDLEPSFERHAIGLADKGHGRKLPDGTTQWGGFDVDTFIQVETLAEAQGIWFDCPKCYAAWKTGTDPTLVGVHGILIWFSDRGVPDRLGVNSEGRAVRWNVSGTDFSNLTLTPSILLLGGCNWHGWVTNGEVV